MYKDFDLDFSSMNGWTQESQNNLTNTMVSQLAKFQTSSSINLFKELNKSSEKINDVNSSINNHIESFKDFVDDFQENSKDLKENMGNLNNALDEYIESQSELNKSMSEIKDNILKGSQSLDEIGEDVRFLKAVTMGGMSATQLKEMIELDILNLENMQQVEGHNGFIQSIDKYKKQLDTLAKVEDVQNRANEISKYAQSISNLANNLGIIDDKTAGDVNTALSAISSGVNIYAGVMTSNPLMVLDGASSLSGLFGKKEPSIEEKRHQQIIQGINKLLKGQEIILEAIASLGEILSEMSKQISSQFNKVYENQKIILDVLISIDEKLTKMHNQEMNKLFEIHYSVLVNREMINYLAFNDIYGACSTFYRKIREYPFNNYQNFSFIFNANVDYFKKCYDGLSTVFQFHDLESSGGFPFSNALKFSWHAKDINGDKFVHQSYMPLYKLVLKYGKKYGYSIEQVFDSSFYPVTSFDDLEKKINNLDKLKISNDFYGKNVSFNKSSTLKSIIHPQAVLNMTDALSRLHGYLNLVDVRNKELMSEKKFLEGQVISNRGEELAFVGLKSIETSIAQLNFLSGDLSLKIIDSIFNEAMTKLNESDKDEKNTYNIAKDKSYILALNTFLLNDNLFKNYLIYRIRRQLKKQDMNFISYKMALNDNNGDLLLKSILNLPWKVVKEERGWFVIVEKFVNSASHEKDLIKIKMPSSVDVEQGIIKYNFSLPLLVKRKQILKNIILGYRIPRNILKSKKNSKEIKRAFLDYLILSNLEGK
jgi:uncharacterized coiled-coil DUF342 family protein